MICSCPCSLCGDSGECDISCYCENSKNYYCNKFFGELCENGKMYLNPYCKNHQKIKLSEK